jgi:hypothetical protein
MSNTTAGSAQSGELASKAQANMLRRRVFMVMENLFSKK